MVMELQLDYLVIEMDQAIDLRLHGGHLLPESRYIIAVLEGDAEVHHLNSDKFQLCQLVPIL